MPFHLDTATVLALLVSFVIPLLSSLLGRAHWPAELLGLLTLALSVANGFVTTWADAPDPGHYPWQQALALSITSALTAFLGGRVGLWKDTATDARALAFPARKAAPPAPATPPAAP